MIFVNVSQGTFCTTCFLLLKVKDSVIGFSLNMPTSLVPPVKKLPSGKGSTETLFRHKCMKLVFLHLLSLSSARKLLVIKGAGFGRNITHLMLFLIMSRTDSSIALINCSSQWDMKLQFQMFFSFLPLPLSPSSLSFRLWCTF